MNKSELITQVTESTGLTRATVTAAVGAIFDAIVDALAKGESVSLPDIGVFKVSERAARKARDPRTGNEIDIPAKKTVSYKAGKALKDKLN